MTATRPVIVNGIEHITKRHDMADRSIVLTLPYISPKERKTKEEIWREFEKAEVSILGMLCNAVSLALKNYSNIELETKPRMADFAQWVASGEQALGFSNGAFMNAFMQNRQEVAEEAVEHDVLVFAVMQAMKNKNSLEGPASQILECLRASVPESYSDSDEWVAPNKFKSAIIRIQPILLANGIQYKYVKDNRGRMHSFKKIG